MLSTQNAYSGFAAKDIGAEKRFYGDTLGIDGQGPVRRHACWSSA